MYLGGSCFLIRTLLKITSLSNSPIGLNIRIFDLVRVNEEHPLTTGKLVLVLGVHFLFVRNVQRSICGSKNSGLLVHL